MFDCKIVSIYCFKKSEVKFIKFCQRDFFFKSMVVYVVLNYDI